MSRIGKRPVAVPQGVEINLSGLNIAAKGPKGELAITLSDLVKVAQGDDGVTVTPADKTQAARSHWGLSRSMVQNIVTGVSEGFSRKLVLQGVGYRAQMQGKTLKLSLPASTNKKSVRWHRKFAAIVRRSLIRARVFVMKANMCSAKKVRRNRG
jgi:ribosomal protein L6P/L9E